MRWVSKTASRYAIQHIIILCHSNDSSRTFLATMILRWRPMNSPSYLRAVWLGGWCRSSLFLRGYVHVLCQDPSPIWAVPLWRCHATSSLRSLDACQPLSLCYAFFKYMLHSFARCKFKHSGCSPSVGCLEIICSFVSPTTFYRWDESC